jgi:LPXTG-motif cell wall-anchored protein
VSESPSDSWPAPQPGRPPFPGRPPLPGTPAAGAPVATTADPPVAAPAAPPARRASWAGLDGARDDLRSGVLSVLVLALAGLPAGLIWLWLAPRASYRVTATGVESLGGTPSSELFMADDGVYVLVLAGLGLLAGLAVWLLRRHRGVVVLAALAAGMIAAALVAWQLGELLGPGPTPERLADVGATVTTGLRLGAVAAVAVGPFVAILTYVVASTLTSRDDLGRSSGQPAPRRAGRPAQQPAA